MKQNIFIGGAWPYANGELHVGHIASLLPGDVISRYYRKTGANVLYVSGTDSHGTPITIRAQEEHCDPIDIANYYHNEFCYCFDKLNFSYDNYTSTCSEYHKKFVKTCIQQIYNNGYLYEKMDIFIGSLVHFKMILRNLLFHMKENGALMQLTNLKNTCKKDFMIVLLHVNLTGELMFLSKDLRIRKFMYGLKRF